MTYPVAQCDFVDDTGTRCPNSCLRGFTCCVNHASRQAMAALITALFDNADLYARHLTYLNNLQENLLRENAAFRLAIAEWQAKTQGEPIE